MVCFPLVLISIAGDYSSVLLSQILKTLAPTECDPSFVPPFPGALSRPEVGVLFNDPAKRFSAFSLFTFVAGTIYFFMSIDIRVSSALHRKAEETLLLDLFIHILLTVLDDESLIVLCHLLTGNVIDRFATPLIPVTVPLIFILRPLADALSSVVGTKTARSPFIFSEPLAL